MKRIMLAIFTVTLCSTSVTNGQTGKITATHDLYISRANQSTSYCTVTELKVGDPSGSEELVTLVKFSDISTLPSYSTFQWAKLWLKIKSSSTSQVIAGRQVVHGPGWDECYPNWSNSGGDPGDYNPTHVGVTSAGWMYFDISDIVKDYWIPNPSSENKGLTIKSSATSPWTFYSRESGSSNAPYLEFSPLPPQTADLSGTVQNQRTLESIADVSVCVSGPVSKCTTSLGNGQYTLTGLLLGNYSMQCTKSGYIVFNSSFDLQGNQIYNPKLTPYVTINDFSVSPSTLSPGNRLTVSYNLSNSSSVSQTVWLGASLRQSGTTSYDKDDSANDKSVTIPAGTTANYSRYFDIGIDYADGMYDVKVAVWRDKQNGLMVERYDQQEQLSALILSPQCEITAFFPPTAITVSRGTALQTTVQVKNNSNSARSYWVGLSFAHETATGNSWPIGYYDIEPLQTPTIDPGQTINVVFSFAPHKNLRPGQYFALAGTWERFNEQLYLMEGPIDKTLNYPQWTTSGRVGLASFSLGSYESTSSTYIEQLRDATRDLLFRGTDLIEKYTNGQKPSYYFSAGVEGDVPATQNSPPFHFGLDGSFLVDLADLFAVTPEGQEWVTVWIDASGSLGTPTGDSFQFKVDHGITSHSFDFTERAIADDRRSLGTSVALPLISVSLIEYSPSSGWNIPRIEWTGNWQQGVSVVGSATGYVRFEVRATAVVSAFANAERQYVQGSTRTLKEFARLLTEEFRSVFSQQLFRYATFDDGDWELISHQREIPLRLSKAWTENEKQAHYFFIDVPTNASELTVQTTGGTGNADLYIRRGNRPTSINTGGHDTSSVNSGNTEAITIKSIQPGRWFIMVPTQSSYSNLELLARVATAVLATVTTSSASSVDFNAATLNGSVNPNGSSTTAWFEYGTSSSLSSYSSTTSQSIGSGTSAQSISAPLSRLTPATTYYFRVAANNAAGTNRGSILSFTTTNITIVEQLASDIPTSYALYQNYPNPFNPITTIQFSLPKQGNVVLTIFNSLGMAIDVLVNEQLPPGHYRTHWIPRDMPSGVYFYQLRSSEFNETKKLLLLR